MEAIGKRQSENLGLKHPCVAGEAAIDQPQASRLKRNLYCALWKINHLSAISRRRVE
jgi:hypothetical protein